MNLVPKKFIVAIALLLFAVVCWKLLTASSRKQVSVSQTAFSQALNLHKIQRVSIYMGFTDVDLKFADRDSLSGWVLDVSTKDLPLLIKRMLDDGVEVDFASVRKGTRAELVSNLLPTLLLFCAGGYIYYLRARKQA